MAFNRYSGEEARLNAALSNELANIENAYSAIGKDYFNAHSSDENDPYRSYFDAIRGSEEKIEVFKEQLGLLRGIRICPECKNEVPSVSVFCNICGARIRFDP